MLTTEEIDAFKKAGYSFEEIQDIYGSRKRICGNLNNLGFRGSIFTYKTEIIF